MGVVVVGALDKLGRINRTGYGDSELEQHDLGLRANVLPRVWNGAD